MARKVPALGKEIVDQIEEAWKQSRPDWARKRLLVLRLIALHQSTVAEIMAVAGVCRQTVFTYRDKVVAEGVEGLLKREWAGARKPAVDGAVAEEVTAKLEAGAFRQARDAQRWIAKRTRKKLTESGVRKLMHRLGGKLKVPRKSHRTKDQAASDAFKAELPGKLTAVVGEQPDKPVRLWVLDEHRYGLLPFIRRVWSRRGVRVHAPYATTYKWGGISTRPLRSTAPTTRNFSSPRLSIRTSTRFSCSRSPGATLTRCMSLSRTRLASISVRETTVCRRTSGCCRCSHTVRSSTPWKASAACSRHPRSTGSTAI